MIIYTTFMFTTHIVNHVIKIESASDTSLRTLNHD